MTPKQVTKGRAIRQDAGSPRDRRFIDQSLIGRLEGELVILNQDKQGTTDEYRETRSNWRTEERDPLAVPYALTEDVAISRSYWFGGVIALLGEMALGAWIFSTRGLSAWVGAGFALAITLIFERAIHFAVFGSTGQRRPKRAIRRLKNFAFYPALACFFIAVLMSIVARTVEGRAAASNAVVVMVTTSWAVLTLGLVFLASSLFAAAFIYSWSERLASRYRSLDRDERASRAFLEEVRREMPPEAPTAASHADSSHVESTHASGPSESEASVRPETARPSLLASISRNVSGSGAAVLLIGALCSASCSTADASGAIDFANGSKGDATIVRPAPQQSDGSGAACHVVVDTSGSLANIGDTWEHVEAELPGIVRECDCQTLDVWSFDKDGWLWSPILSVSLPRLRVPEAGQLPAELAGWSNFREAAELKRQDQIGVARLEHDKLIALALAPLDSVAKVLEGKPESEGSNPVGVLRRIALTPTRRPAIFVVVTDMADTNYGTSFPAVAAPRDDVRALVVLAPATPEDATLAQAPRSGPEQYEQRQAAVQKAMPWVQVVPYFVTDIGLLLSNPRERHGSGVAK